MENQLYALELSGDCRDAAAARIAASRTVRTPVDLRDIRVMVLLLASRP
jgi:hypothetical protein